jgi:excisionase family DNA binding protein
LQIDDIGTGQKQLTIDRDRRAPVNLVRVREPERFIVSVEQQPLKRFPTLQRGNKPFPQNLAHQLVTFEHGHSKGLYTWCMNEHKPEWITVREAAELKKISVWTVRRYITQGRIQAERIGPRLIRVNLESLNNLGAEVPHQEMESK